MAKKRFFVVSLQLNLFLLQFHTCENVCSFLAIDAALFELCDNFSAHSFTHRTDGYRPEFLFHCELFFNCVPFLIGFCIDAGHDFFPENELGALIFGPHCHFVVLSGVFRQAVKRERKLSCIRVCASVLWCIFISFENVFLIYAHPHGKKYVYIKCIIDMDICFF